MLTMASCDAVSPLLTRYNVVPMLVAPCAPIPGSYWGESEAGLIGDRLYFRSDTPLHSVLHEACHYICMDEARRAQLERDAGGDYAEENAVCYLQILLAGELPGCGRERMCADMDAWGYTFRLGSARAWFERDADDARQWLIMHGLITSCRSLTWRIRTQE
jgi:hypothetical protein